MNAKVRQGARMVSVLIASTLLFACTGDDGSTGPVGPTGPQGPAGEPAPVPDPVTAAIDSAKPESCATCHNGVGEGEHQSLYDKYTDETRLTLTFDDLSSSDNGNNTYTVTLTYTVKKDNWPVLNGLTTAGTPNFDEYNFVAITYDSATRQYVEQCNLTENYADLGGGQYSVQDTNCSYAPEDQTGALGAHVYGYVAQGALLTHEGGAGSELPEGTHVHLYDDVASAALAYGTAAAADDNAYESAANVSGCESCHGKPYLKHGYRNPIVAGLPDFASCRSCHTDDRFGYVTEWQYMVDDPANWASAGLDAAVVNAQYAYAGNLMNDAHMSHAMEFPFPQSMSNCATCHAGKLDQVLDNSNFTAETCKSCHPVQGLGAWPKFGDIDAGPYYQEHRAPPMAYLWAVKGVDQFHNMDLNCQTCHGDPDVPTALPFNQLHTGYDVNITDADGVRYDEQYSVSIDQITRDGDLLTIEFSASDDRIKPEVLVSFYGWDSKHFLIPSHAADGTMLCLDYRGNPAGCEMEFAPGTDHPLFTDDPASVAGDWKVTLDMSAYVAVDTDDIPTLIANGDVKYAEITVTPELTLTVGDEDVEVVLDAVGETFDLNGNMTVSNYFKGSNATVSTDKCDVCHDSLASSFHAETGRGGGGIQVCKNCHNPTFAGSHLEMASRSIENYVHAIHSFQDFDPGDIFDGFDAVLAKRYDDHIKHVFPNFTIRNCEACHLEGTFDVPDQSQSIPGLQSASDSPSTWYEIVAAPAGKAPSTMAIEKPSGRNIATVPEAVTGPASRACGGCHRARLINQDEAGALAAFNEHVKAGGTYVENDSANNPPDDPDDEILYGIIDKIMSLFE